MMLLLFESVHRVMEAEHRLKTAGVPHELLPTPKEISAECGMCLGTPELSVDDALAALDGMNVHVTAPPEKNR